MANRLVNLAVKNIAAVERPANRRRWLLMKSATSDKATLDNRIGRVYMDIGEHYGTLMTTMNQVATSSRPEAGKTAACKTAVMNFVSSVQKAIPSMVSHLEDDYDEMEKAGKKISAERLAKLRTLYKTLGEIITEGEEAMGVEKKVPDANALTKIGNSIAAMFGRAAGADEDTIAALEKAVGDDNTQNLDPAQKMMVEAAAANAELRKSLDDLKARADKAEATLKTTEAALAKANDEAKKLREEKELAEFRKEVESYADIGMDAEKDATLLKSMTEKLDEEQIKRLREIFKSTAAVVKKGTTKLFKEVGASGSGGLTPADTAIGEVDQRIAAIVQKGTTDRNAAMREVFEADPDLYNRWRSETRVKV